MDKISSDFEFEILSDKPKSSGELHFPANDDFFYVLFWGPGSFPLRDRGR